MEAAIADKPIIKSQAKTLSKESRAHHEHGMSPKRKTAARKAVGMNGVIDYSLYLSPYSKIRELSIIECDDSSYNPGHPGGFNP